MQELKDHQELIGTIEKISNKKIKKPQYPIAIYVQEATNRYFWASDDKEALRENGLDTSLIDDLPGRINALRIAEAYWYKEQHASTDNKKRYKALKAEAVELRWDAIESFRFAFYEDKYEYERMADYKKEVSDPQLIQELLNLSYFGSTHKHFLQKINYDFRKLDRMAVLCDTMADVLAACQYEDNMKTAVLDTRNKAFTYMRMADNEICRVGRFVFADVPDRLRGYTSDYRREHRYRHKSE